MAKRLLLIGNDDNVIDLFFDRMESAFGCVTCSTRLGDLLWHKDSFNPDAVVYCMLDEDDKKFSRIASFKSRFLATGKYFIVIGSEDDCESFRAKTDSKDIYTVANPGSSSELREKVEKILDGKESLATATVVNAGSSESSAGHGWADILNQLGEEKAKKHILVIDDDPLMLKVVKDYLHEDYDVATAKSGQIAYKFLEKKHTDLILLDYEMPDEKGPDVFKNIRAIQGMESVPIVFLTGVKDKERLVEIVKIKPQGYIQKPVERNALFEMINKVMV
ncbi:MAG: response regulator [Lachnospiraceae bacterium]|nr:response regulator [Lachnospiraceae bacterium]